MATERVLKRLMDRAKLFPDRAEILRGPIEINKNKLITDRNYAGIIDIIRCMSFYEKDSFLEKFYERNPDDYLFILIFANSESDLYTQAKEKAEKEYQYDIDRMRDDVRKSKDEYLSEFLRVHDREEDYWYVFDFTDNDDERHLSSHKKATDYLINLENSRFGGDFWGWRRGYFSSSFYCIAFSEMSRILKVFNKFSFLSPMTEYD